MPKKALLRNLLSRRSFRGRGDRIRTYDLLTPSEKASCLVAYERGQGAKSVGKGPDGADNAPSPRRYTGKIELLNVPLLSPKDFSAIPME